MENHSSTRQREKLIAHLRENGSATAIELRHRLDIMMPAVRIHELRHCYNHNIVRPWDIDENPGGTNHRMARYVLKEGNYKEAEL